MNYGDFDSSTDEFPTDLRAFYSSRDLVSVVLECCQEVPLPSELEGFCFSAMEALQAPLLLTVLAYSYACNILPSEEIVREAREEAGLKYLCGNRVLEADLLRRFRRQARDQIKHILTSVLLKACQLGPEVNHDPTIKTLAGRAAETRINNAVRSDSIALDI